MGRVSENAALRTQLDAVKRAVAQLVSASSRVAMRSTCDHRALSPVFLPIPISKWTFKGADRSLPAGVDRRKTVSTPAYWSIVASSNEVTNHHRVVTSSAFALAQVRGSPSALTRIARPGGLVICT